MLLKDKVQLLYFSSNPYDLHEPVLEVLKIKQRPKIQIVLSYFPRKRTFCTTF